VLSPKKGVATPEARTASIVHWFSGVNMGTTTRDQRRDCSHHTAPAGAARGPFCDETPIGTIAFAADAGPLKEKKIVIRSFILAPRSTSLVRVTRRVAGLHLTNGTALYAAMRQRHAINPTAQGQPAQLRDKVPPPAPAEHTGRRGRSRPYRAVSSPRGTSLARSTP
jgi:hypothetical protein